MKLAPAPNVNKANAVQKKYKSTLEDISWSNSNSSFADSSSSSCHYSNFDSSQEECMRVADQQERRDKREKKDKKEKKRTSSKKSTAANDGDTSSNDNVLPMTCKFCIKYSKIQHPTRITPDTCMWNKKVRKFRFNSVCRKMNLKFIEG